MSIKTILVPAAGSDTDYGVFETALAVARPLAAHLEFYHLIVDAIEAASNMPHAGFTMGAGLVSDLAALRAGEQARLLAARDHFEAFCRQSGIAIYDRPQDFSEVSANWSEESGDSLSRIMHRARCSDLVVVGRKKYQNHLPENLIDRLLLESGRPILLAPSQTVRNFSGTVMVCWKECRESAHAIAAAMPLLQAARRVFIVSVSEEDSDAMTSADGVARQMLWHGIHATPCNLASHGQSIAKILSSAARDYGADLVIMGAYGRGRLTELIFGGCTDAFLRAADYPVLLAH